MIHQLCSKIVLGKTLLCLMKVLLLYLHNSLLFLVPSVMLSHVLNPYMLLNVEDQLHSFIQTYVNLSKTDVCM